MKARTLLLTVAFLLTSVPHVFADADKVLLNFFADGEKILTAEVAPNVKYDLEGLLGDSSVVVNTCRGYEFKGWKLGSPVAAGEIPDTVAAVKPVANINLYAVFYKALTTTRYVRVMKESELQPGWKYLIVAHYWYNGNEQYYALNNSENYYKRQYQYQFLGGYYRYSCDIGASQITPSAGAVVSPNSNVVWRLSGESNSWKLTNDANTSKVLNLRNCENDREYTGVLLTSTGAACSITAVEDGVFDLVTGSYHLVYSDEDYKDYFTTRTSYDTGYPFYIYKLESPYTSYPDCSRWKVYLDAVDGLVNGASRDTLTQASANATVRLPAASVSAICSEWEFAGWHVGNPVETTNDTPTYLSPNTDYSPEYNGVQLYAVYRKKRNGNKYTYSSYPHCVPYVVYLHPCGGKVGESTAIVELYEEEDAIADPVTLPSATPLCDGWRFVGWLEGEDLPSAKDVKFTDVQPTSYSIKHNQTHLYAVYERTTDKFLIIGGLSELETNDDYLITYYASDGGDDMYDFMLSSNVSGGRLAGVKGVAPQNDEGYYMLATDSACIWKITGAGNSWQVRNLGNNGYLVLGSPGTSTQVATNTVTIQDRGDNLAIRITNGSYYLYCNDSKQFYTTNEKFNYTSGREYPICYIYRRVKEYTSWPHCKAFTVKFDGCGGNAAVTKKTEGEAYEGIILPEAYANSDCSREGWVFAGWAEEPIEGESESLTRDLLPEGVLYHPSKDSATLYAVYYIPTNKYRKITSKSDMKLGVKYIIATSGNKALSNTSKNTNYITPENITLAGGVITNVNNAIEWRLQGSSVEYVFYNIAGKKYINLTKKGYALLTDTVGDNFTIQYAANRFIIRSNMSLVASTEAKYLGYDNGNSRFNTVAVTSYNTAPELYLYQQQATYNSYPSCLDDIEALYWTKTTDGDFVVMESYLLANDPLMTGALGRASSQTDGTYLIKYSTSALSPCTKTAVTWGGTTANLSIPYVVDGEKNSSDLGGTDCSTCDYVVLNGGTLNINQDKSVHTLTIYDGGTLNVVAGKTLTVNSLVLYSEGDQAAMPTVNLNGSGVIALKNGELYHDRRIDEERYYWLALPYDAQLQKISYSNVAANGGAPTYRGSAKKGERPFWVKSYNGALRAQDVNGGGLANNYWQHVTSKGSNYTMQAGQGYIVGIGNQKDSVQADGRKHTKRVLRFTMKPGDDWLTQEASSGKVTMVQPSAATDGRNAAHVGWNLIGNPYMRAYTIGNPGKNSGLQNGSWVKDDDGFYVVDEDVTPTDIPYLTVYSVTPGDDGSHYSQVLARDYRPLRPFEAVFVQVNTGNQIYFKNAGISRNAPAYMRFLESEDPVRTGVVLSGAGQSDATGIVLSEEYTTHYEIGADLEKMLNGGLNLYTLNADNHQLAFNGLSDEDAEAAIPVGVTIPAAGEYTFAFDAEQYNINDMDTVMLIDYTAGTQTNLLYANYSFVADEAATVNNRFALLIRRAQAPQVPTGMDETYDYDAAKPRKVIRDGQLFIIYDDKVYNAVGVEIK